MIALYDLVKSNKAILFDLFHTLTAPESASGNTPSTSQLLGISREDWNTQLLEKTRDRLTGAMRDPYCIVRTMAHAIDPSIPEGLIRKAADLRIRRFASTIINIPEKTVRTLQELRNRSLKLGLISNADVTEIAAWPESPLKEVFHSTVFSCYEGMVKPEPDIYRLSMRQLGVTASDCIFVGDGGSDELRGAQEVGLTTVMITGVIREIRPDTIESRKQHADYTVESIDELIR